MAQSYTPEAVEEITGVPAADLEAAAHMYAEADRACILWGLGVTEHKYGSEVVQLICNLALMTGNVGRPGAALLPLRGQNNVQGSSDMGALPDTFTDYRPVSDDAITSLFEERWGVKMKREKGMKIPEMFDAAVAGDLKAMYIFGEDVAQTDPDTAHVAAALESLDFLVCQEIFENETTKYADVILPSSSFLEKTGTFTNAERRVQLVEAANEPPGEAKTDFEILTTVSAALGHEMDYETPSDVMDEVAEMTPRYAGLSHERIGRKGLMWPVAADGTDSPILYEDEFETDERQGPLRRAPLQGAGRRGRRRLPADPGHRAPPGALQRGHDDPAHRQRGPDDRRRRWRSIPTTPPRAAWTTAASPRSRSRVGEIKLPVQVTEKIEPGHVFTTFHFPEVRTNLLVGQSSDVNTSCPEYKVIAVAVEHDAAADREREPAPRMTPERAGASDRGDAGPGAAGRGAG